MVDRVCETKQPDISRRVILIASNDINGQLFLRLLSLVLTVKSKTTARRALLWNCGLVVRARYRLHAVRAEQRSYCGDDWRPCLPPTTYYVVRLKVRR